MIRSAKLNGEIRRLLDGVSAKLTTENVTQLVGKVAIDGQSLSGVAWAFLAANGLR